MGVIENPNHFPQEKEKRFFLKGSQGKIEVISQTPALESKGVGIICHPHPLHGGTMTNKVVHTVAKAFFNKGIQNIRFNFRGVGKSEGSFDNGKGETQDLLDVIQWVKEVLPTTPLILAGFSFGAYVASAGAAQVTPLQLLTIAPAVSNSPYDELPEILCPWTVFQGESDEVVSVQEVVRWYDRLKEKQSYPTQLIRFPEVGHFFHGHLVPLRHKIESLLMT